MEQVSSLLKLIGLHSESRKTLLATRGPSPWPPGALYIAQHAQFICTALVNCWLFLTVL